MTLKDPTIRLSVISISYPIGERLLPWRLEFKQSSFYHVGQLLQERLDYTNFVSLCFTKDAVFTIRFPFWLTLFDLWVFDTFPQNLLGSIQHAVTWRTVTSLMLFCGFIC